MFKNRFKITPCFGNIPIVKSRFSDCDLFPEGRWQYATLKKIKLWYGSPKSKTNLKALLGIQCTYINLVDGKKIESPFHGGDLSNNDIEVKEVELTDGDYFTNFYIAFDKNIYHIKIATKNKKSIEFGFTKNEEENKNIEINDGSNKFLLQCFIGFYNENEITALGCKYISKNDYLFIHAIDILRLRHLFKNNENEKNKWTDDNNLNKLSYELKAIVKLCLLPDAQFSMVINYYI